MRKLPSIIWGIEIVDARSAPSTLCFRYINVLTLFRSQAKLSKALTFDKIDNSLQFTFGNLI